MRAGGARWRARTTCYYNHLRAHKIAQQHEWLAVYWRRPQPQVPAGYDCACDLYEHDGYVARPFHGPDGFCAGDSEDFQEPCLTAGCNLPLIESFECEPAVEGKPWQPRHYQP